MSTHRDVLSPTRTETRPIKSDLAGRMSRTGRKFWVNSRVNPSTNTGQRWISRRVCVCVYEVRPNPWGGVPRRMPTTPVLRECGEM